MGRTKAAIAETIEAAGRPEFCYNLGMRRRSLGEAKTTDDTGWRWVGLRASGVAVSLCLVAAACASGNQAPGEATSASSGVDWSSSSSSAASGGAGQGGSVSTSNGTAVGGGGMDAGSGGEGAGGTMTGGVGGFAAGGAGGAGGSKPNQGALVAVLAGVATFQGAVFSQGAWTTTVLGDGSSHPPAAAMASDQTALAVYRQAKAPHAVRYTFWDGAKWAQPADVAPGVTTRDTPSLHAAGGAFDLVFHGDDFKHYFARYTGLWSPTAEQVGNPQSFGPSPATLFQGASATEVVFAGDDKGLYAQLRSNNAWQAAVALPGASLEKPPAAVELSNGDGLVVFLRDGDGKLMFNRRQGSSWSNAMEIDAGSFASLPPKLLALPQERALLVFRGLDNKLYTSRYQPKSTPPWTTPFAVASPNPTVSSLPSLVSGIDGSDAELLFVSSSIAYHSRLTGLVWSMAQPLTAAAVDFVAAASRP